MKASVFLRSTKGKLIVIASAVLLAAAVVLTVLLLAGGETGYRSIYVSKISGSVMAENNGNEYKAYENMRLGDGYVLTTGTDSYTRLTIDGDKYLKLEQESRAVFTNVGSSDSHVTAIDLEFGNMTSELVNPLGEGESFVVNTPNAVLAVRGTFFRVDITSDSEGRTFTSAYTYGGTVACRPVMPDGTVSDKEVMIIQGSKLYIETDGDAVMFVKDLIDLEPCDGIVPITAEDLNDEDIVDIYGASYNGHAMFMETAELWQEILDRDIDLDEYSSVYDAGEMPHYTEGKPAETTTTAAQDTETTSTEPEITTTEAAATQSSTAASVTTTATTTTNAATVPTVTTELEKTTVTAPDPTPEPVITTTKPVTTTTKPEPVITTTKPVTTTTTPEPVITTTEPVTTTPEPVITTTEPVTTTPEPVITTSTEPEPTPTPPSPPEPPHAPTPAVIYAENGSITISATGYTQGENTEEIPFTGDYVITQAYPAVSTEDFSLTVISGKHNITLEGLNITDSCVKHTENGIFTVYDGASVDLILKGYNFIVSEGFEYVFYNAGRLTVDSAYNTDYVPGMPFDPDYGWLTIMGMGRIENCGDFFVVGGRLTAGAVNNCEGSFTVAGGSVTVEAVNEAEGSITVTGGSLKITNGSPSGTVVNSSGKELICKVYDYYPGNIIVTLLDGSEYTYMLSPWDTAEDWKYYVWLPVHMAFADEYFYRFISTLDSDGDGYLSENELGTVTEIKADPQVKSLSGIEYFTNLERLDCSGCTGLTYLDVSKNSKLIYLDCSHCQLAFVDVSMLSPETELYADGNIHYFFDYYNAFSAVDQLGLDPRRVTVESGAVFDPETGWFTEITGDIIYTYDCGHGYTVTFTLIRMPYPYPGIYSAGVSGLNGRSDIGSALPKVLRAAERGLNRSRNTLSMTVMERLKTFTPLMTTR